MDAPPCFTLLTLLLFQTIVVGHLIVYFLLTNVTVQSYDWA
jgi:hypothetical protein